jgi:uncharacterized protein YegP (UPF0339 family)
VKFILRKSSNSQWYFTIHASNGLILASSETYHNRQDAVNAGYLIINNAGGASFEEAAAA